MSLSFLIRLMMFLVLVAIFSTVGWHYGPAIGRYLSEAQFSTTVDADIDKRSLVYRLQTDRPLVFVFSQPVDLVRLLTQSAVAPDLGDRKEGFVYAIEARLFDATGAEIAKHTLHLHSDAPDIVYASGETWRFFRNRTELVAGMDDVVIEAPRPATRSEWRLIEADDGVEAVDIRVYERRPLLASQALAAFRRRSKDEQLDLAQGNAFPPALMTQEEMASSTANMWRPLGPTGIAGRDYQALVLYEGTRRENFRAKQQ